LPTRNQQKIKRLRQGLKSCAQFCCAAAKKIVAMKLYQFLFSDPSGAMLYLFILFADLDYTSIVDYTVKALIGGGIWFAFKLLGDHYQHKIRHYHKRKIIHDKD
jgi:hypothetical protein